MSHQKCKYVSRNDELRFQMWKTCSIVSTETYGLWSSPMGLLFLPIRPILHNWATSFPQWAPAFLRPPSLFFSCAPLLLLWDPPFQRAEQISSEKFLDGRFHCSSGMRLSSIGLRPPPKGSYLPLLGPPHLFTSSIPLMGSTLISCAPFSSGGIFLCASGLRLFFIGLVTPLKGSHSPLLGSSLFYWAFFFLLWAPSFLWWAFPFFFWPLPFLHSDQLPSKAIPSSSIWLRPEEAPFAIQNIVLPSWLGIFNWQHKTKQINTFGVDNAVPSIERVDEIIEWAVRQNRGNLFLQNNNQRQKN